MRYLGQVMIYELFKNSNVKAFTVLIRKFTCHHSFLAVIAPLHGILFIVYIHL